MIPDTVVVINRTIPPTDYTPLIIGLSAPILVAIATGINIFVQRRIADKAVETQQQLSADAIAVQQQIAAQTVTTQLDIARKENVVQSRREWGGDVRATFASFRSVAGSLALKTARAGSEGLKRDESEIKEVAELFRLQALIRLYLDLSKESHNAIYDTVVAVNHLVTLREDVEAARTETPDTGKYRRARKFKTIGEAFVTLDDQVSDLLESNWEKIKAGA
jgi:hypothetical protein